MEDHFATWWEWRRFFYQTSCSSPWVSYNYLLLARVGCSLRVGRMWWTASRWWPSLQMSLSHIGLVNAVMNHHVLNNHDYLSRCGPLRLLALCPIFQGGLWKDLFDLTWPFVWKARNQPGRWWAQHLDLWTVIQLRCARCFCAMNLCTISKYVCLRVRLFGSKKGHLNQLEYGSVLYVPGRSMWPPHVEMAEVRLKHFQRCYHWYRCRARWANRTWYRNFATSASTPAGLLLVGGFSAPWTSEVISRWTRLGSWLENIKLNNKTRIMIQSETQEQQMILSQGESRETFVPNPGRTYHCSIKVCLQWKENHFHWQCNVSLSKVLHFPFAEYSYWEFKGI